VPGDQIHRTKPIKDIRKHNFIHQFQPFENISTHDSLSAFKGRLSFKQYIPAKKDRSANQGTFLNV
jgi:hypothetical protein